MRDEPAATQCPIPPDQPPDVRNLVGLAFSGGGIRSASFNLGVLQGLESRNVLWMFDYLSTVSGGGFIGSWWSAWLSREKRQAGTIFPANEELEPGRRADTAVLRHADDGVAIPPGPPDGSRIARRDDPIHFLRLFSNYLTPRKGAFSPDTWRLIAFYARGLIFTWIVLLPILLAAVMFGQTFFMTRSAAPYFLCPDITLLKAKGSASIEPVGDRGQDRHSPASDAETMVAGSSYCARGGIKDISARSVEVRLKRLAKPMAILFTIYATLALLWLAYASSPFWLAVLSFFAVGVLALWKIVPYFASGEGDPFYEWSVPVTIAGAVIVHGVQALSRRVRMRTNGAPTGRASTSTVVTATAADYRGMLSKQQAWLLRLMTFLGALLLVAGFGHDVVDWLIRRANAWSASAGWSAVATALVSGAYTIYKALPNTHGAAEPAPGKIGKVLMTIAPAFALAVLALGFAWLSHYLLRLSADQPPTTRLGSLVGAAAWLGVVQLLFAIVESHRDPSSPPPVSAFWHRVIPESVLPIFVKLMERWFPNFASRLAQLPRERERWVYLFSPQGWVRVSFLVSLWALLYATHVRLSQLVELPIGGATALSVPFLTLSTLVAIGLVTFAKRTWPIALGSARPAVLLAIAAGTAALTFIGDKVGAADDTAFLIAPLWIVLLIGFVICTGWLADPNLLSIHGFYKGRLARAYLGASNTARLNEEITDSAPGDDLAMTTLWNHDAGGPYHIINATLSLVGASDLAMSQRSAENFVMSRYHCGSARAGYRCSADYMDGQLSLATAAAISGAAVSPNMGSTTPSAALALFLSLFNVRLGFWAPTPAGRRWREPHARLWPFYILRETLSNTGQIGSYCYLTDGGHFDNTALYSLIERGCRYIVVCDCGADPDLGFEDIGVAIRRCRIDFGTEINLRIDEFVKRKRRDRTTKTHVVWGTIHYQQEHLQMLGLDAASEHGVIVWIKPAVTARDSADVQQYHRANLDFPQQSTADQWYDESQFESYRRLGYDSARDAFDSLELPSGGQLAPGQFADIPAWFDARLSLIRDAAPKGF